METNEKHGRPTIRDVSDERELELLGIKESVDGSPVNSYRKISQFINGLGIWEDPVYKKIQDKYRGKLRDKEMRKKYHLEVSAFVRDFYKKVISNLP